MSERYSRLYALPGNLYAETSPVVIAAGALLKDNETGNVLAQLKLKSISDKNIKAVTVSISAFDTFDAPLGEPISYQYLDMNATRDAEFGAKKAIFLPDATTRKFSAAVTSVAFADNSVWKASGAPWEPLPAAKELETVLDNDHELWAQYRIQYGRDCDYAPEAHGDLWYCACGALNHQEEANCHSCGKSFAQLRSVDLQQLRTERDERLAAEAKKAAEEKAAAEARERERKAAAEARAKAEKAAAEARAKKAKKIAVIVASIAAVTVAAALLITKVIIPNGKYNNAVKLMEAGQYEDAIAAFEAMDGYKDSVAQIEACNTAILDGKYNDAVALADEGKTAQAAMAFAKMDYKDSAEQSKTLWDQIAVRETVSAGTTHTIGLKSDGTVVAVGSNKKDQCNVGYWTDIVAVTAGNAHTVGLRSNGMTISVGDSKKGQLSGLVNIVSVSAGYEHTVGLKPDGTVVAVGSNASGQCNVSDWTDIVAVFAGGSHTVGLKVDGTVVAAGKNSNGQCDVSDWTDIVSVSAGSAHTVGLKSDGTVVAVGRNGDGQCEVSDWTDIVAVSAGTWHTVGLKSDGTVVAVGNNASGQCEVSGWTDIVAVSAGKSHTVGLKSDGTVVAAGNNASGRCDVSDWKNIKLPKK